MARLDRGIVRADAVFFEVVFDFVLRDKKVSVMMDKNMNKQIQSFIDQYQLENKQFISIKITTVNHSTYALQEMKVSARDFEIFSANNNSDDFFAFIDYLVEKIHFCQNASKFDLKIQLTDLLKDDKLEKILLENRNYQSFITDLQNHVKDNHMCIKIDTIS